MTLTHHNIIPPPMELSFFPTLLPFIIPPKSKSILCSFFFFLLPSPTTPTTLSISNHCPFPIWPALLSGAAASPLPTTGFLLDSGDSLPIAAPSPWSGRLWARTLCSSDPTTHLFSCSTADCSSGAVACSGAGAAPSTLAEFTLAAPGSADFFDVSLVDGYNLPLLVVPELAAAASGGGGSGRCGPTGCLADVNAICPPELRVVSGGQTVACRSACGAFGSPEYCCREAYGGPGTCKPTVYSQLFKNVCPRAYSYAYDDATSTFTCAAGTNYAIIFCPSGHSLRNLDLVSDSGLDTDPRAVVLPLINDTMEFLMGSGSGGGAAAPVISAVVLGVLTAAWCFFSSVLL